MTAANKQESIPVGYQLAVCQLYMLNNERVWTCWGGQSLYSEVQVKQVWTCVTVCFGIPRTSGWPYCTKPWLPSPAGLGNRPLRPWAYAVLRSWRPQRWIECSKRHCRLRDVKRITASCRNDVMIPYKRSCPVGNAVLWLPTANWTVSRLCPTVCSPGTIPEALTVSLNKAAF